MTSELTTGPPNIPGESEPPDLGLALAVAITLLADIRTYFREGTGVRGDLDLRMVALLAVLRRLLNSLEGAPDDGQ